MSYVLMETPGFSRRLKIILNGSVVVNEKLNKESEFFGSYKGNRLTSLLSFLMK